MYGDVGTHAPYGHNSFNFMQSLGEFNGKLVCSRPLPRRLKSPPLENPGSASEHNKLTHPDFGFAPFHPPPWKSCIYQTPAHTHIQMHK